MNKIIALLLSGFLLISPFIYLIPPIAKQLKYNPNDIGYMFDKYKLSSSTYDSCNKCINSHFIKLEYVGLR